MPRNEPVDARVRLAISLWPRDAPRGAVTSFCREHGLSRKTFYVLLTRARSEGQAAALEPRSRRPHTSPSRIPQDTREQALGVRAALESSGLDHGPISVHDKMISMGVGGPLDRLVGANLPARGCGQARATKEAPGRVPQVCVPRTQRMLATGRHAVRLGRRSHLCDLSVGRRPLSSRNCFPRR